MKAAWKYIEQHHEEFGVALFVCPAVIVAGALIGIAYLVAWAFQ